MRLADLTWPQVAGRAGPVLLAVPLGATEQHGPHLPHSVDTDIAVALCEGLADRRADVVVAPPLSFGASGEHAGFPGTLSIGTEALTHVLVELARSATDTFGRVLFVSGHGGNGEGLRAAVAQLRSEGRDVQFFEPRWSGDAHAGRAETSLLLHLDPRRVRLELAEPGNTAPLPEILPLLRARGIRAASANGILGNPAGASAEEGRVLLARLTDDLVAFVERTSDDVAAIATTSSDATAEEVAG
ncbi:mycofactocin biosynthesis peptidyl-dipeptidase MftE [Sporichthya polymorpha]|uniref:mycofactocin biosynthesis peptidyl-dipeptidase MftE n=1 Tax=Sporichthya polymorpha TaxID=35751 RepID=UPI0003804EC0|nr:mycofactocin biosynthesis peptidyl-dipeptidase MftE [Sporichthya polymorpha]